LQPSIIHLAFLNYLELMYLRLVKHGEDIRRVAVCALTRFLLRCFHCRRHFVTDSKYTVSTLPVEQFTVQPPTQHITKTRSKSTWQCHMLACKLIFRLHSL